MARLNYALSLKQPWAALVVHGLKTVEVRAWPTRRRGRVLIHAARRPDDRPAAWSHVPSEMRPATELVGGIVGAAELVECVRYRTFVAFLADHHRHLNEPDWFRPPGLFGFCFANPVAQPFVHCTGQTRFFPLTVPKKS
jgi:ASCH domain